MTFRTSRRIIWAALVLMLPVPVFAGPITAFIPVVRVAMLGAICASVLLVEGSGGVVDLFTLLLFGQALAYLLASWLVAALLARLLARIASHHLAAATLGLVLTGLVLTLSLDLYGTPFRLESSRSNLLAIFE